MSSRRTEFLEMVYALICLLGPFRDQEQPREVGDEGIHFVHGPCLSHALRVREMTSQVWGQGVTPSEHAWVLLLSLTMIAPDFLKSVGLSTQVDSLGALHEVLYMAAGAAEGTRVVIQTRSD